MRVFDVQNALRFARACYYKGNSISAVQMGDTPKISLHVRTLSLYYYPHHDGMAGPKNPGVHLKTGWGGYDEVVEADRCDIGMKGPSMYSEESLIRGMQRSAQALEMHEIAEHLWVPEGDDRHFVLPLWPHAHEKLFTGSPYPECPEQRMFPDKNSGEPVAEQMDWIHTHGRNQKQTKEFVYELVAQIRSFSQHKAKVQSPGLQVELQDWEKTITARRNMRTGGDKSF